MSTTIADLKKTKHTQKGFDLFVVSLTVRVPTKTFYEFMGEAKDLGGWWSGYNRDGAVPGFQFKTETAALAFLHILDGKPSLEQCQQSDTTRPLEKPAEFVPVNAGKLKAEKLRKLAEGLTAQIEDKRRPMTQNPTPKRNKEYRSRLHDSDNLERVQQALFALADAHEAGIVAPLLANLTSKSQIAPLVHKGLDGGGYYDVIPCRDYRDKSPAGLALQAMIERPSKQDDKKREISLLEQQIALSSIPGFFPTPENIVQKMLDFVKPQAGEVILEPSAGSGAIACMVNHGAKVEALEMNHTLNKLLTLKGINVIGGDFMEFEPEKQYDGVLMNPPFERGQDLEHIRKAYAHLKDGGRMAAICSPGFAFRQDTKFAQFRDWVESVACHIEDLPSGTFQRSGTGVAAKLIFIQK